jgi:hypothetical protein
VAVAYHGGHAGHPGQFLWRALRRTAGHHDPCSRVQPVRPANEAPRGPVGLRRHAARIDNHHIRRRELPLAQPRGAQPVAYRLAIRAGSTATEMLHVKSRHDSSLKRALRPMQKD